MLLSIGAGATIDLSVDVNFGKDSGQNFGTLFEAHDENGTLVFGAGFAGVFNTYHRAERYKVQFFVRPTHDTGAYTMEKLPPCTPSSGAYAFELGHTLYARSGGRNGTILRQWDAKADTWENAKTDPGYYCATVRGKPLTLLGDRIVYDGKVILEAPKKGRRNGLYYGGGHLFFYHRIPAENSNHIVAVPWSPYAGDLSVDMSRAVALKLPFMKEFPYAWGQLGRDVLNCSNWGGLYVFNGTTWRVPVEADEKTSYQIYSMITYHDKLYMAQYPTGRLLVWDGTSVTDSGDWPPVPAGASASAREAQTTMLYRGELMVGVWPWAELWRYAPEAESWELLQRMFTHPPLHRNPVHPYEKEATAAGLVLNELGQRLTSMVPYNAGLILTTSSKGGAYYKPETLGFLSPEQRAEYGADYRLTMPGNLAGVIAWRDKQTRLRFTADKKGRMVIYQDGIPIAETQTEPSLIKELPRAHLRYGKGVYGPFTGKLIRAVLVNMKTE